MRHERHLGNYCVDKLLAYVKHDSAAASSVLGVYVTHGNVLRLQRRRRRAACNAADLRSAAFVKDFCTA